MEMEQNLIVKDLVEINAPVKQVWDVLTKTEFYKQWDDIPEGFSDDRLELGSVIEWEGYSKLTVTEYEPYKKFRLSLFLPRVNLKPTDYDVSYTYLLTEYDAKTVLTIEIGDFSTLPDADSYYEASSEFLEKAKEKIKELAEQ
jgi:uncharacterized protein YndB with AHSA1/START domain